LFQGYKAPPATVLSATSTLAKQADTRFTCPAGMEGWVNLVSSLYNEIVYLSTDRFIHQSISISIQV